MFFLRLLQRHFVLITSCVFLRVSLAFSGRCQTMKSEREQMRVRENMREREKK